MTYYFGEKWRIDFETNVLHRVPAGKTMTTGDDIEASISQKGRHIGSSIPAMEEQQQQQKDNLYLARITSKHSAV